MMGLLQILKAERCMGVGAVAAIWVKNLLPWAGYVT